VQAGEIVLVVGVIATLDEYLPPFFISLRRVQHEQWDRLVSTSLFCGGSTFVLNGLGISIEACAACAAQMLVSYLFSLTRQVQKPYYFLVQKIKVKQRAPPLT